MLSGTIAIGLCLAACASGTSETDATRAPATDARVSTFVDDAPTDSGLPSRIPSEPTGALGFDRYVWMRGDDGQVIPVVVEGPREGGIRCQDPEDMCSYRELKALHDSGGSVPAHLDMTAAELGVLVHQLDQTAATVEAMADISDACAAGYMPVSAVNPNMGIHMTNPALITDGFDPAAPEMLLYSSADAIGLTRTELGGCDDGRWTGIAGLQVTGAAFFIDMTDDHPDGFAGDLDNWHVHYNSCASAELDSIGSKVLCDVRGGTFFEVQPNWMMHAYVAPGFDSQTGVFGMWNDSVWPLGSNAVTAEASSGGDPDQSSTITDFMFESVTVASGETVEFGNDDNVPHTVSAGTPGAPDPVFNSGLLAADSSFQVTLEEPGDYSFFCELHPSMQASIRVE